MMRSLVPLGTGEFVEDLWAFAEYLLLYVSRKKIFVTT